MRNATTLAVTLTLVNLLIACGDRIPATPGSPGASPGSPTPTSSPSPTVTSAGFLHVLQHPWVMTYEIDPSGRLRPPVTQHVTRDLNLLAGEPSGRFVYGAHGGWPTTTPGDCSDLAIVTYSRDPRDGTLSPVSDVTLAKHPANCDSYYPGPARWIWLKGDADRVHGLWMQVSGYGHHVSYTYMSIAVAGDGRLGSSRKRSLYFGDYYGEVLVNPRTGVVYTAGPWIGGGGYPPGRGGLAAHVIGPDGTLDRTGWTNLCFARTMEEYGFPRPLVSARGFVFASCYSDFETLCAYQGLRLKPLYALDLDVDAAEAFVPSSEAEPALLAMNVTSSTGRAPSHELRVFSMNAEGDLRPAYSEELPDSLEGFQFHPSGRSLYTVDRASRLRAYAIGSDGRMEPAMQIDNAGGSMAITLKDAQLQAQEAGQ